MPTATIISKLMTQIEHREARIAVIGLGYVGLPLLTSLSQAGFAVTGIDIDARKVAALTAGESYIQDVPAAEVKAVIQDTRQVFSTSFAEVAPADVIIMCVPTPLRKSKEPDISHILAAAEKITTYLHAGQMIILESTSYPGTTDEILLPMFASKGLRVGEDFLLVFSPERVDPGNGRFSIRNIPKVIGGVTPNSGAVAAALYQTIIEQTFVVSSARVAETAKILENTFRSVNIALVNEFSNICRALNIDVWEVIDAAATKPFGFMRFQPGPGIGGHCIPLDPHYLIWKSRLHGYEPRFMALAEAINSEMPEQVLALITDALNDDCKALKGSRILLMGVAYKADIDDVRESPALEVFAKLRHKGANVIYHDPFVSQLSIEGQIHHSQALNPDLLAAVDAVAIITAHSQVDYALLAAHSPCIIDTRNVMRKLEHRPARLITL